MSNLSVTVEEGEHLGGSIYPSYSVDCSLHDQSRHFIDRLTEDDQWTVLPADIVQHIDADQLRAYWHELGEVLTATENLNRYGTPVYYYEAPPPPVPCPAGYAWCEPHHDHPDDADYHYERCVAEVDGQAMRYRLGASPEGVYAYFEIEDNDWQITVDELWKFTALKAMLDEIRSALLARATELAVTP